MASIKSHKSIIIFSIFLGVIIALIIYALIHYNANIPLMGSPNSLNMLFVLIIFAFVIIELAFIYYLPKKN